MIKLKLILLLKKGILKHRGSFLGISILFFIITLSLVTALSIAVNSSQYIALEMKRLGFGDITVWVQQNNQLDQLSQNLKANENVHDVKIQPLIFAGYSINNIHSDNEGQLLAYLQHDYDYSLLDENFNNISNQVYIAQNEIYVSPAMHSTYQFNIGDKIEFNIGRSSKPIIFTIKGYFEDPFMGSSMIDMKSFLINERTFTTLTQEVQDISEFNKLANVGAMMHIFQKADSPLSTSQFNQQINEDNNLTQITQFTYTQSAIYGFMMILQNMLTGFLGAFVIVLLIVSMIVIGYNINHALELERKDMGFLKMIGFANKDLRMSQILQYGLSMMGGMLLALLVAFMLPKYLSSMMITSTGLLIPTNIPYNVTLCTLFVILCLMMTFIWLKTKQIVHITPIETVQKSYSRLSSLQIKLTEIKQKRFIFHLAKRQLISGKRRYIGTLIISIVLVFFLSVIGKIDTWIGPHGEGLMNAFSVAEHDLGVQPMTNMDMNEVESLISSYADIEEVYELAMQNVLVNGMDYTANIINEPSYFHIIRGQTSRGNDEIVVTESVAKDLGIDIGDIVNILYENKSADYKVVGIYQCANEMGANIGMNVQGYERIGQIDTYIWCRHYLLSNHSMNDVIMTQLQQHYPLDIAVHTNSWSGLEGIVSTMNFLTIGMYGIVALFILIMIVLTGSKMLYFEKKDMAILKSIGLTFKQLRISFTLRFTMVVLIGAMIGTLLSLLCADSIMTYLVAMFGIGEFHSRLGVMNSIIPIFMTTVLFTVFAYLSFYRIKKEDLTQLIKGD